MTMIKDKNGKVSASRILAVCGFVFACCLAIFSVFMAVVGKDSTIISNVTPVIIAFLTFSGGIKGMNSFAEGGSK